MARTATAGLHALSQALNRLRKALGAHTAEKPFLLIEWDAIQFDASANYMPDMTEFTHLLAECQQHAHRPLEDEIECRSQKQREDEVHRRL